MSALLALAPIAASAFAQVDRRVLVDADLQARSIRLISLSGEVVIYEDDQGRRRQATLGGFVALLPATPPYGGPALVEPPGAFLIPQQGSTAGDDGGEGSNSRPMGALTLHDGQRFPGEHAPTGDSEALVWRHPRFGPLTVPLDDVAQVVLDAGVRQGLRDAGDRGAGAPEAPAAKDEIVLINGDSLAGFLLSLGNPIEIEVDGAAVAIPHERVVEARLAGKPEPLSGMVVWLEDGSVAVVASIETRPEGVDISLPGGQKAEYPLDALRAVAFDAGRLRPLASLRPTDERPVARRVLLDPVRTLQNDPASGPPGDLNAPDVELPGPMSATWALPAGARRFAAVAEMPLESLPWGDCELVVSVDGVERLRDRLNAETPRKEFSVSLSGSADQPGAASREMVITVEPGAYGPVNDRVILRRPLLLVDERESAPGR